MKVHVISDAARRGEAAFEALLLALSQAPPDFFQVREKEESDRALLSRVRRVRSTLPETTVVLVNGRPDVAVAGGAQGVQLPSDGLPLLDVRRAFPPPFVIGQSCHAEEDLRRANAGGADFALYAPIYAPTSKPDDTRKPLGPEALDHLGAALPPIHALGGLTVERIRSWPAERRTRVTAVAGIGLFHDALPHVARVLEDLRAL